MLNTLLIAPLQWEGSYLLSNFLNKPSSCWATNCVNIASWFTTFHLSLTVRLLGSFDPKSKAYDKKDIFHALFGVFINETACERSIVNGFTGMMDLTTFTIKHNSIWSMDDLKRTGDMMNVRIYSFEVFGGDQSFLWVTDTPVLDFWGCLPWVSKPMWIPSLACFIACTQWNPQITLCCNTCWSLCGQHGSWNVLIHVFVNKHWWGLRLGSIICAAASQCETRQMLYQLKLCYVKQV